MEREILSALCAGLPLSPLPENKGRSAEIAHAAKRTVKLSESERQVLYIENKIFVLRKHPLL